jgi:primosomal protein N' (replication factor Y)
MNVVEMHDGGIYSKELLEAVRIRLDRGEQTVLFLNRRGYSRSMTCVCGFAATCGQCDIPYTYHRSDGCLRCHVCGGWAPLPKVCPQCGRSAFSFEGIGTQRAEAALAKCFPKARILRMDADSTSRKNSHDDILGAFRRREADILLGTQMIAKGLDFPNVTLVGVLNADSSLNMADFRAEERTFQLLSQVSGRAGRSELPGEVFIQTRDATARTIRFAAKGNYEEFARQLPAGLKKEFTSDAFDTGVKQITDSAGKMVKFRYLGALNGPVFTNYLWAVEFSRDSKSSGKVVQELLFKLTIAKADNSFQVTSFGFML